jgi:hypothetical protein
MSIQRDECCIANPTRNSALVDKRRASTITFAYIESEKQLYGISNTVSSIYNLHIVLKAVGY